MTLNPNPQPPALREVFFTHPDMLVPQRFIAVHRFKLGTEVVIDLDVYCTSAVSECRVACSKANWLELSTDGGSSYNPIPIDAEAGINLGAQVVGDRTSVKIKVVVASGIRRNFVELKLGIGS